MQLKHVTAVAGWNWAKQSSSYVLLGGTSPLCDQSTLKSGTYSKATAANNWSRNWHLTIAMKFAKRICIISGESSLPFVAEAPTAPWRQKRDVSFQPTEVCTW